MISSAPLAWTVTALFTVTGCYAVARWSTAVSAGQPAAHRTAELAHLVMSVAMVVMTWTWPGTTGLGVQIALFAVFGGFFAVTAVRGTHCGCPGRVAGAVHALMAAAMVWMLAAMPLIMPLAVSTPGGAHGAHGGHEGHGGAGAGGAHAMPAGQAGWAVAVTVVLCGALLIAAGFWAVRAVRGGDRAGDPFTPDDPGTGPTAPDETAASRAGRPGAPAGIGGSGTARATGSGTATSAFAGELAPVPPRDSPAPVSAPRLGAREDAACHAAMSLGMVLMLAAMVAGW